MKNNFLNKLKSKIKLNIQGRNINNFIKRLNSNNIELLNIEYIKYNEINIIIYKNDYEKVIKLKTIYEVTESDIYGIMKVRKVIRLYRYIILFLILGLISIIFLSNIIFDVEVIHVDSDTRTFIKEQLEHYNIKKYKFKKSFQEIQTIKNNILEQYKDKIEWLEIEQIGTKYVVRLETRIIKDNDINDTKQNVIAKKNAIIKSVKAEKGVIVKEINQFVNKGDVIISGNISLNEEVKEIVGAKGIVYGEVWYTIKVDYPYVYNEVRETGNIKNTYVLRLLNKDIELTFNKYQEKITEDKVLLGNTILPFQLLKQKQRETKTISLVLTEDEAVNKGLEQAIKKMQERLKDGEEIIDQKILKVDIKEDKVTLDVFFSVLEDITDYEEIEVREDVS